MRKICIEYHWEILFGIVLSACVLFSYWAARFIPVDFFNQTLSPIMNGCIATVSLFGAILMLRHNGGVHVRFLWVFVLLAWTVLATMFLLRAMAYNIPIRTGETLSLKGRELLIGNVYAWLFMCYPVAVLRPGWLNVRRAQKNRANAPEPEEDEGSGEPTASYAEYRAIIDEWMQKEKPYLNPEFRLSDLRQAVPLNRTYLSQLINTEYGCSFYQFVTNYRIEEAKRLMQDNPNMFIQDIAEQSGFSSPTVFSRTFAREVGLTPKAWSKTKK